MVDAVHCKDCGRLTATPDDYRGINTVVPANLSWNPRESLFLQIDAARTTGTARTPSDGQSDEGLGHKNPQNASIRTKGTIDTANLVAARRKPTGCPSSPTTLSFIKR